MFVSMYFFLNINKKSVERTYEMVVLASYFLMVSSVCLPTLPGNTKIQLLERGNTIGFVKEYVSRQS